MRDPRVDPRPGDVVPRILEWRKTDRWPFLKYRLYDTSTGRYMQSLAQFGKHEWYAHGEMANGNFTTIEDALRSIDAMLYRIEPEVFVLKRPRPILLLPEWLFYASAPAAAIAIAALVIWITS